LTWQTRITPWDLRALVRSASLTCALLLLAVLVTAATDEGRVAWSERVARAVPLVPVCAALGVVLALAGAHRRGEERALEALGRTPFANACGAAVGAASVGAVVALLILLDRYVSITPFFPTVQASGTFVFDHGTFTSTQHGWRVMADGSLALAQAQAQSSSTTDLPPYARESAAVVTLVGSAAFALTVAVVPRGHSMRTTLLLLVTAAASAVCLQAAASSRVSSLVAPIPSTLLLLVAAWGIVRPPWIRILRARQIRAPEEV